ncbi:MAG: guanylate kinase [Oscillospiraceae bacterium]|nr:guanylate kinase [Oscillospiraceae bacterium]
MRIDGKREGLLIVLSGPSGCGKGTIVGEMLKRGDCAVSVSATTRDPRPGEVNDVNYHFLKKEQFTQLIAQDRLLEYAQYCDNYYGTLRDEVDALRAEGKHVILEIEVQGAMQIKERCPEAVLVYTLPPSVGELYRRLKKRGTETDEVIEKRIRRAGEELPLADRYDFILFNDVLEDAVADFSSIIRTAYMYPVYHKNQIGEMIEDAKTFHVPDHIEE